jgi:hypothetical protein
VKRQVHKKCNYCSTFSIAGERQCSGSEEELRRTERTKVCRPESSTILCPTGNTHNSRVRVVSRKREPRKSLKSLLNPNEDIFRLEEKGRERERKKDRYETERQTEIETETETEGLTEIQREKNILSDKLTDKK